MGQIHQEDKTIISLVHELKITTSKYMKKTLTERKGKTDSNTIIIIGDGNTPLSTMDGSFRVDQLGTENLNNTTEQMDLKTYRTFHPTTVGYIFFSSVHKTFSRINKILSNNKKSYQI